MGSTIECLLAEPGERAVKLLKAYERWVPGAFQCD